MPCRERRDLEMRLIFCQKMMPRQFGPKLPHNEVMPRHGITRHHGPIKFLRHLILVFVAPHNIIQTHSYLWGVPHPGSSRRASFSSVTIVSRGTSGTSCLKKQYNVSTFDFLSLMRCSPPNSWQRSLTRRLKFYEGVHVN